MQVILVQSDVMFNDTINTACVFYKCITYWHTNEWNILIVDAKQDLASMLLFISDINMFFGNIQPNIILLHK